jgi:hypothetical protein
VYCSSIASTGGLLLNSSANIASYSFYKLEQKIFPHENLLYSFADSLGADLVKGAEAGALVGEEEEGAALFHYYPHIYPQTQIHPCNLAV